jgi:alkaline phosphatase D
VYETYLDLTRSEPRPAGADGGAETLAEYRAKYAAYRSDPDLRAMHAAHAFLPVWDDHEVANDYAGGDVPGGRREPDPARRRQHAYQAWFEAMPVERPPRQRDRIYRRLRVGRHLDLFALDTRQYRVPKRTLLGAAQEEWLVEGLTRSRATWKVLGSSVLMMDLNGPGSESITGASAGSWQAFPDSRAALGEALLRRGVQDVAAVTGDAHAFYAGTVATRSGAAGRPFATEFSAGTLAASNAGSSAFESLAPASAPALAAADRANTPTLAYSNAVDHGYAIVEAGPRALDVTFRAVETIQRPRAAVRDLARFTAPRGEIGPQTV